MTAARLRVGIIALAAVCLAALVSSTARAQPSLPWVAGVSEIEQKRALEHFNEGVKLHEELLYAQAAREYGLAIDSWAHPKFYLYQSLALAKLGRSLEAYQALQSALTGDRAALSQSEWDLARRTERELLGALSRITVRCDEPGAVVRLNGQRWFACAGHQRRIVRAGDYRIDVGKPDFVPVSTSVSLKPGEAVVIEPKLIAQASRTSVKRRWRSGMVWAVTGVGAALMAAGWFGTWHAARDAEGIQRNVDRLDGGSSQGELINDLERAHWYHSASQYTLFAGGGVVATSLLLHWLNRPEEIYNRDAGGANVDVTPLLGPNAGSIRIQITF